MLSHLRLPGFTICPQGEIVPATRERLLDLYYGIVKKDTDAVSFGWLPARQGAAATRQEVAKQHEVQSVPLCSRAETATACPVCTLA